MDGQGVFFRRPDLGLGQLGTGQAPTRSAPTPQHISKKTPFFWEGRSRDLATEGASCWPETDKGGEISMERPKKSSDGAAGAEFWPISLKNRSKTWIWESQNLAVTRFWSTGVAGQPIRVLVS